MSNDLEIVQAFIKAIQQGRIEEGVALLADDIVLHHTTRLPYAGEYRGHAGFRTMVASIGQFWSSFDPVDETSYVEHDGAVVVVGTLCGTARSSGTRLTIPVIERYRVEGDRIAEVWPYYVDTHLRAEETV